MKRINIFVHLAILAVLIQLAHSATLTWTGRGGNNLFTDPKNFDLGSLPTLADHVDIPSGNIQLTNPISVGSLRLFSGVSLTVRSTLTYAIGITVEEGARLDVVHGEIITNTPPIISTPGLTVTPSVTYPTISVIGKCTVEESLISGATPNSSGNVEPTSVLNILNGGTLLIKSRTSGVTTDREGFTTLRNIRVVVASQGKFIYGPSDDIVNQLTTSAKTMTVTPLLLAFCVMNIHPGGQTIIQDGAINIDSTVTSSSSSSSGAISSRPNRIMVQGGELIFDVSMLQQLAKLSGAQARTSSDQFNIRFKPEIDVFSSGLLLCTNLQHNPAATGSTTNGDDDEPVFIQLLGVLDVEEGGRMEVTNHTQVALASPQQTFLPQSQLNIRPQSTIYCEAGQSIFRGIVNSAAAPQGSIVVRATTHLAGEVYIMDLFIYNNLSIGTSTVSTPHVPVVVVHGKLFWSTGTIEARGVIRDPSAMANSTERIRVLQLAQSGNLVLDTSRSSRNRVLKQVQLHIHSPFAVISSGESLILQQDAGLFVFPGGILNLHGGSSLIGDDSNIVLHVANGGTLAVLTDHRPILVDLNVVVDGLLIAGGKEVESMGDNNIVRFRKDFVINSQLGVDHVQDSCAHIIIEEDGGSSSSPSSSSSSSLRSFQPQTKTVLKLPQQIIGEKLDISLYNKSISLSQQHQWQFRHLALINSSFHVPQIHLFGMLIVGDETSPGRFLSDNTATVGGINLQHGIVEGPGIVVSDYGVHFFLDNPKQYAIANTVVGPRSYSKCHADAKVEFIVGAVMKFEQDALFEVAPGCELVDGFNDKTFLSLAANASSSSSSSATNQQLTDSLAKYQQTLPQLWLSNSKLAFVSSESGTGTGTGTGAGGSSGGDVVSSPSIIDVFIRNNGSLIECGDNTNVRLSHSLLCEDGSSANGATSTPGRIILGEHAKFDIANYPVQSYATTHWNRQQRQGGNTNTTGNSISNQSLESYLQTVKPQLTSQVCRIDNGDSSTLTLQHGAFAMSPMNVGRVVLSDVVTADFAHGCYEKAQVKESPMTDGEVTPIQDGGGVVNPPPCDPTLNQPTYPPGLVREEDPKCTFLGADSTMMGWLLLALAIFFLITTLVCLALMLHYRREYNETQKKIATIQRHHRRQSEQQQQLSTASGIAPPSSQNGSTPGLPTTTTKRASATNNKS